MSGVGRGRGWLNIKREQITPGGKMTTITSTITPTISKELDSMQSVQTYMSYIDNTAEIPLKYSKAFHAFETIFKIHILHKTLADFQYSEDDKSQCIIMLCQEYLVNWNMNFQAISNAIQINRKAVLNSAQNIFENKEYLFKKNKSAGIKLMIMLVKLHGLIDSFFIGGLAAYHCGTLILDPVHNDYVPIYTKCLHLIFNSDSKNRLMDCLSKQPCKIKEILRAAICSTHDAKTRYWLFLAMDILNAGPTLLPEDTLTFYAEHLGQAQMNYFRQAPDTKQPLHLDIGPELCPLEQYVSEVSVLKIDDSPANQERQNNCNRTQPDANETPQNAGSDQGKNQLSNPLGSTASAAANECNYQQQVSATGNTGSGSGGRAILGSGARNNRKSSKSDSSQSKGSPRDGAVGAHEQHHQHDVNEWQEVQPHRSGKPPPRDLSRNHSAWNHDDRC